VTRSLKLVVNETLSCIVSWLWHSLVYTKYFDTQIKWSSRW